MSGFVWLASYPKSGNTWFRVFITNYQRDDDAPANINELGGGPIASARETFDDAVGYDSGEMTPDEIDRLRPEVYRHMAREAKQTLYCKAHDAYTFLPDGQPLFPPEVTERVIYLVRNPLDVCVSYAHHEGHQRFDRVAKFMADEKIGALNHEVGETLQLRQRILSWSGHVSSWADAPGISVKVVRYEDLKLRAEETFGACVKFLGLPFDAARLEKAIKFSGFEELRSQEQKDGFTEKLRRAGAFFRKGELGSWRQALSPEVAARIISDHAAVMRRFGYLDDRDKPVF